MQKNSKIALVLLCTIVFCSKIIGQLPREELEPNVTQFLASQGLDGSIIYDILRDSQGFLWIATDGGLSKYDGYQFERINLGSDMRNFSHDDIKVLRITEDKMVFFGCFKF